MALKSILDTYYEIYKENCLESDPIFFPHQYNSELNIEIVGLISALMAIGNVKQIKKTISNILEALNPDPFESFKEWEKIEKSIKKKGLYHRFFDTSAILAMLYSIHILLNKYKRLKNYFVPIIKESHNLKEALTRISNDFLNISLTYYSCERKLKLLYPSPKNGSACKRWLLYLRWMIRREDGVDFGIWQEISPTILLIPIDTHIYKIATSLKLTKRKNPSWKMAEEITNKLREFDPFDPVKYDFALTRILIMKKVFLD